MAPANNSRRKIKNKQQIQIRCMQINVQHSRVGTDNLMNLIQQDNTFIVFVQEHTTKRNSRNYKDTQDLHVRGRQESDSRNNYQ